VGGFGVTRGSSSGWGGVGGGAMDDRPLPLRQGAATRRFSAEVSPANDE